MKATRCQHGRRRSTEQEIAQALRELDASALYRLQDLIDVLLAQAEGTSGQGLEERGPGGEAQERRDGRGWVELKLINGYGPYAYLRWWQGRRKRSR